MRRRLPVYLAFIFALAVFTPALTSGVLADEPSATTSGTTESACYSCHSQEKLSINLPSGEQLSLYVNTTELENSVHGGMLQCNSCHSSISGYPHPPTSANSVRDYQLAQKDACLACHSKVYTEMQASVHGVSDNGMSVATCTDCHGAHAIQDTSTASFRIESVTICSGCHGNQQLMQEYGISTKVVATYLRDFHGKTTVLTGKQSTNLPVKEAVCTDCHGVHNIQKTDSANSAVIKTNLANTCRQCHPGASDNFTSAWLSHNEPSTNNAPVVFAVRWFYYIMVPFVLVGLVIHILLDLNRKLRKSKGG